MRIFVIGFGQAGGKIADLFVEFDRRTRLNSVIRAIAIAEDFSHAAKILRVKEEKMEKEIAKLSRKGFLPSRSLSFRDLKRICLGFLMRYELMLKLDKMEKDIEEIKKKLGL